MSHKVFANGREISSRSGSGKAACCFPDVCFTPPPPPGIPIPYPNTAFDRDTKNGSRSVRIKRRESMLKNKSYFKKSTGDEPGRAPKKGVISSTVSGKVYFKAWSMDVKIEGLNVVRHMDLTTHNHASEAGNTLTWPFLSSVDPEGPDPCAKEKQNVKDDCRPGSNPCEPLGTSKPSRSGSSDEADKLADKSAADKCLAARRCALQPREPNGCCYPQTPHHLIEAAALHEAEEEEENEGTGKKKKKKSRGGKGSSPLKGVTGYNEADAPCVCAEGMTQNTGTHALMHTLQNQLATSCESGQLDLTDGRKTKLGKVTTYGAARDNAIAAMQRVFPQSQCGTECIKAQVDDYHNKKGLNDGTQIKAVQTGSRNLSAAESKIVEREIRVKALREQMESGGTI